MKNEKTLTEIIAKNDGLSIFTVSKQSRVSKNLVTNILEKETALKAASYA